MQVDCRLKLLFLHFCSTTFFFVPISGFLFLNCVIFIAWRFVVGGLEFESSEDGFVALRRKESEGEGQWF